LIPCYGIESGNEHHFKNHVKESDSIPKAVVQALQIKPSSLLMYEIEPGAGLS
jgi:hypothetical protein